MQTIVVILIVAVAAIILFKAFKGKAKAPVSYDKNFNEGYTDAPQKPKKQERI